MKNPEFVFSTILAIAFAFIIAIWVPGEGTTKVKLAICYAGLVLLFLFGFLILAGIASGKIDIGTLLAESGGGRAHESRGALAGPAGARRKDAHGPVRPRLEVERCGGVGEAVLAIERLGELHEQMSGAHPIRDVYRLWRRHPRAIGIVGSSAVAG